MYASQVKDQKLTFAVSGMLWQRSLVMVDSETKTLWSHLLGQAMRGPLKGTELESIPSVITDWESWYADHPTTTVLDLERTSRRFTSEFYERDPAAFVVGMAAADTARSWAADVLQRHPVVNDEFNGVPLVLVFSSNSFAAHIYDRRVKGKTLAFSLQQSKLVDRQSRTVWDIGTGKAVSGKLKGEQLKPLVSILSFRRAWEVFHPESTIWRPRQR